MKPKRPILFLLILAYLTICALPLQSQVINKRPAIADDPMITAMVAEVNTDTILKTLQELQAWGSRFMLNDNHKAVATSLMNKFKSYGYADVKLDSFYCAPVYFDITYPTMQYNVVCTLKGSSAPGEIYVIGAHYDSYGSPDPYNVAPGVDDNGSGTAATLEIARAMAKMNYQPEATIQLILFAGEELGLLGSQYAARKARLEGQDIRLNYTMDMISYNPENLNEMAVFDYPGFEWACKVTAISVEKYTGMPVIINKDYGFYEDLRRGTDSYSYWTEGFPALGCWEAVLSFEFYHSAADTLGHYNIPYLAKIAGGVLASVAEQEQVPVPQNLAVHSDKDKITLEWKPTANALVKGISIYRSDTSGCRYQKLFTTTGSAVLYHDLNTEPNRQYYYVITTVNESMQESFYSNEATGARINFSDTLLVLANLEGTLATPDSVFEYYRAVLDTIPFVWHDINAIFKVNPGLLSRYRSILWMSNTADFEVAEKETQQYVSNFISNGGNLLYAGFNPMKFWTNITTYPKKIPEAALFRQLFKVDTVSHRYQCMMNRANAVSPGFDTLNVNRLKNLSPAFPGQIFNIDIFTPADEAVVIYRFDSKYDYASSYGRMKNKPVGLEYKGDDFRSILLSFPLYYIDTSDARAFLAFVMKEKFNNPLGIEPTKPVEPFYLDIYPNPFKNTFNMSFALAKPGHVKIELISVQGQILNKLVDENLRQGSHCLHFDLGPQTAGTYLLVLQCGTARVVRNVVLLK